MRANLKKARKDAGLTQKQVAKILGTSERQYQHLELGTRLGRIEYWDKLEDLFNVHQRVLHENHDKEDNQGILQTDRLKR